MNFANKIIKNKGVVTIISFIICFVIVYFAYQYRVNQVINKIRVPVAKIELAGRTQLTSDNIEIIELPSSMITSDVITDESYLKDKFVNYNTTVPAGGLFYRSAVVKRENMPDSAWENIPEGHTIVSLPLGGDDLFRNTIYPNDQIDLYYKTYNDYGKLVVGRLIAGIKVLAVKDEYGNHIFKKAPGQNAAAALIFSVDEEYHLLLRMAQYQKSGTLFTVPRNYTGSEIETTITSEEVRALVMKNAQILTPTEVEEEIEIGGTGNNTVLPNIK